MKQSIFVVLIACTHLLNAAPKISPPQVTASFDDRQHIVIVKWTNREPDVKTFVVQRSENGATWADIGFMQLTDVALDKAYVFIDKKPLPGNNYYRLKVNTGTTELYAAAIMVITTALGNNSDWVMYPVPVTTLLNLQYKGNDILKGVVNVIIQMMNGRIITRYRGASLSKTIQIPVDNLGKGVYDIRIVIENEVVWNQRFVK